MKAKEKLLGINYQYNELIDEMRSAIGDDVKEQGGVVLLNEDCITVLLSHEGRLGNDYWDAVYPTALLVDDDSDELLMKVHYSSHPPRHKYTKEDVLSLRDASYVVDWDCGMSYQHNVERLAYIINKAHWLGEEDE